MAMGGSRTVASIHHELNAPGIIGAIIAMALITPADYTVSSGLDVTVVGDAARMGMPGFVVVMVVLTVIAARMSGCGMVGVSTGAACGYYALPMIQGSPGGRTSFLGLVFFTASALAWAAVGLVANNVTQDGGVPDSEPVTLWSQVRVGGRRRSGGCLWFWRSSLRHRAIGRQGAWCMLQAATAVCGAQSMPKQTRHVVGSVMRSV